MENVLHQTWAGNSIAAWITASAIILVSFLAIRVLRAIVLKKLLHWTKGTASTWDDFILRLAGRTIVPAMYVLSVWFALQSLTLPGPLRNVARVAFLAAMTFFVLRGVSALFRRFVFSYIKRQDNSETKEKQANGLILIVNFFIWTLGILSFISNLGYNVTTLIAGLGIGGIAIALAAQTILGDLFSYFVIFFDRPFEIGDFILVDDKLGVIEYIGIKTTRIRTLNGEQLVCSNTDLTNSRIHNYKRMDRRRVVAQLRVTYQTSEEKLTLIPAILRGAVEGQENVMFDRAHFAGFGESSLNFELVYYIESPDYVLYMDKQQAINLDIYAAFRKEGIHFAHPTQTLYLRQTAAPSLS